MKNSIEKTCMIEKEHITIVLCDIRDNYIVDEALGEIGSIHISKEGTFIFPNFDQDLQIQNTRTKLLIETFKEIFGDKEHNLLSSKYYYIIKNMIENNELETLGFIIEDFQNDKPITLKKVPK